MKKTIILLILATAFLTNAFSQLPSYVPTNGLMGYWTFTGDANDGSGNGNNGVVNGATLTTDRFGNTNSAYSFDGTSYISVPNSSSLTLDQYMTLSYWINPSSFTTSPFVGNMTIAKGSIPYGFNNWFNDSGFAYSLINGSYTSGTTGCDITDSVVFGTWYHVTVVYDSTYILSYLNGTLINSCPILHIPSLASANSGPMNFGKGVGMYNGEVGLTGKLDDIGFWNRALSQDEITQLYTSTTGYVGINTTTPARNLDVKDVLRLEPRATAPDNPSKGDIYFDSTVNKLLVYDGTTWQSCW